MTIGFVFDREQILLVSLFTNQKAMAIFTSIVGSKCVREVEKIQFKISMLSTTANTAVDSQPRDDDEDIRFNRSVYDGGFNNRTQH